MRQKEIIASGVAQANTGGIVYKDVPDWAEYLRVTLSVDAAAGNTPLTDLAVWPTFPRKTAAVVVATGTAGSGSANEVQTISLTGGPTEGAFKILWGGVSANVTVATEEIPATASAAFVQRKLNEALQKSGGAYKTGDIVVTRAGTGTSGDPYVYTLTFSGASVALTDVDAVTITDLGLHTTDNQPSGNPLGGFAGVTQIAGTTSGQVTICYGPGVTGIANDTTTPYYSINTPLPERVAFVLTFDRTSADETYTYIVVAEWIGRGSGGGPKARHIVNA